MKSTVIQGCVSFSKLSPAKTSSCRPKRQGRPSFHIGNQRESLTVRERNGSTTFPVGQRRTTSSLAVSSAAASRPNGNSKRLTELREVGSVSIIQPRASHCPD